MQRRRRILTAALTLAGLLALAAIAVASQSAAGSPAAPEEAIPPEAQDSDSVGGGGPGAGSPHDASPSPPAELGDPSALFWQPGDDEEVIEQVLQALSPEEVIAQVFMVGWEGEDPSPEVMSWITERGLGGIKVFGWNGRNVSRLVGSIGAMQETSLTRPQGIPLLVATDQEGGWVRHIKDLTSETAGNMALGATGLARDAWQTGLLIGEELRAMGVNMNFAPTVDVLVNPEASVIGPRAFADDPELVSILGLAFYQGHEEARVIATAKHFPGHGNARGDSHGILPLLDDSLDELWSRDLLPYRVLVREGVPAILSGHLSFPVAAGDRTPASLSGFFKTEILRERLGFSGVVITDDLYMRGATIWADEQGWTFGELTLAAILAGSDLVMLSRTPGLWGEIWNTVATAYHADPVARSRIRDAARRILLLKRRYLGPADRVPLVPDPDIAESVLRNRDEAFILDSAARAVSVIRDVGLPLASSGVHPILVGTDADFFAAGRERFPQGTSVFVPFRPDREQLQSIAATVLDMAGAQRPVILGVDDPGDVFLVDALAPLADRLVLLSALDPSPLDGISGAGAVLAVYGAARESYRAGMAVIAGDIQAFGAVPLERLRSRGGD